MIGSPYSRYGAAARGCPLGAMGPGGPCSLALTVPLRLGCVASVLPLFVPPQRKGAAAVGGRWPGGGRPCLASRGAGPSLALAATPSAVRAGSARQCLRWCSPLSPGQPLRNSVGARMPPLSAAAGTGPACDQCPPAGPGDEGRGNPRGGVGGGCARLSARGRGPRRAVLARRPGWG